MMKQEGVLRSDFAKKDHRMGMIINDNKLIIKDF